MIAMDERTGVERLGVEGRGVEGRSAVVTGGASGIGRASADRLHGAGATVAVWDADAAALDGLPSHFGAVHVDVTDPAAVDRAARDTGAIDVLVHSAGISGPAVPALDYDYGEWERGVDVNLKGTFLVNRAGLRSMRERGYGRIVNIASIAGKEGNPNASAYSASKAGVIGLTKSLAKEHADADIAVNCVTPAAADTPILAQVDQRHIDYMLSKIPRGRLLELDEVSAMILWLASAENSFATGAVFDISGGRATY